MPARFKCSRTCIWIAIALIALWLSWSFLTDLADAVVQLWAWRPETVVGLAMIIFPILAAYPTHYFLNVRRTTAGGVIKVSGFTDYMIHGLLALLIRLSFSGSVLAGVFILLFGWDIH